MVLVVLLELCISTYFSAQAAQAPAGVLQKLGRVLREKAAGDFQRVFQGTSKTREKLGVRLSSTVQALLLLAVPRCSSFL